MNALNTNFSLAYKVLTSHNHSSYLFKQLDLCYNSLQISFAYQKRQKQSFTKCMGSHNNHLAFWKLTSHRNTTAWTNLLTFIYHGWSLPVVEDLKSLALPVPEIIAGTQKIWAVPGYAHAPFSPKLLMGFYLDWPYKCTRQIWSP